MVYPYCGTYASLFKILAKYHYGDILPPRIKMEIIYGSEGGNSYEMAKEFLTEFIEAFKHLDFLLNEIEKTAKKNTYKIESLEKETTNYFQNYLKYISSFLKDTKKNQFEELDEEYERKRKEEKEGKIQQQGNETLRNEQQKKKRKKKKVFKKRVRKRSKRKERFRNYINYRFQSDKISLTVDFKSGNDFKIDMFTEQTKYYDLNLLLFFMSTYADGSFPNNAVELETELSLLESNAFRSEMIENTFYSCVGLGNKLYGDKEFCRPIVKCDNICSVKMNRFNTTIKMCETENMEEIFFKWKVEMIKIMFLSVYIYYSYKDFMQVHTIFSVSPWNGPICLNNCCLLFSSDPFIQKIKNYRNGNLSCRYNERSIVLREKHQTEFVFLEKKTGPFEIFTEKNKNDEESENVTDPYENYSKEPTHCCSSNTNSNTNTNANSSMKTNACSCQTESIVKCGETCKESQSDAVTDSVDNLNELNGVNGDYKEMIDIVENCSEEDIEDLLQVNKNREMITPNQREKLIKEGYKIIGSHSAVKLCRWTKSQLRGRGGCYKNSFYGIVSYQCMETTPSLACANKCVFCWRHHKNPVGTEWRWKLDDPQFIVKEGIEKHRKMIKELKGAYGVIPERYEAAFNVRHCALSLVGEPIMYPKINKLINELHSQHISTFLVTNAQFPEALRNLKQVTQLYVSIDASSEERLKKIDRPLFKDFWKRYIECIKILRNRKERTVFRFTLVKEYNMIANEMNGYAHLVKLGFPDFIEIKAATYCGSSNGYQLTMKNIPWYSEVCQFATNLIEETFFLREHYELACQHKHSCSVLIAKKKFKINDKWHTWIDYDKFHALIKKKREFDALEYCAETPHWALCGSKEEGFNPMDVRVYTKGRHKQTVLS